MRLISSPKHWRIIAVTLFLAVAFVLARQSDFISNLDPYAVREVVAQWGALSALGFIALYAVGLLLYVPGTLFTVAGALLFGQFYGFAVVLIVVIIFVLKGKIKLPKIKLPRIKRKIRKSKGAISFKRS